MGASLWDQVWLPLLIGLAIQIIVTALCFLSVRLWNCLMKQIKMQTAVEESAHDQPLPNSDAAALANATPDLEMGTGYAPGEGRESTAEPELELGIVNSGERESPKGPGQWRCHKRSPCEACRNGRTSFPARGSC